MNETCRRGDMLFQGVQYDLISCNIPQAVSGATHFILFMGGANIVHTSFSLSLQL